MAAVIEFRSDQSPTVIYACGACGFTLPNKESAERCCVCARCGQPLARRSSLCQDCSSEEFRTKQAARRAKAMERPPVEHDGPVYVADNEHFYPDAEAAADALWDDGIDPLHALAHPCTVGPVSIPDLHTYVDESWAESFEDGVYDEGLTKAASDVLDECVKKLAPLAPIIWTPNLHQRVQLPEVPR